MKPSVSITLDKEILDKGRALADYDDRSLSQYINILLKSDIAKKERDGYSFEQLNGQLIATYEPK